MAAGSTYEPIATTTLGSAQANVTFSSISGSYTDLVLIIAGTLSSTGNVEIEFNNDTGSNYSSTRIIGDGSSASSANYSRSYFGLFSTNQGNAIINIQNYSNSTTYKTYIARGNYPSNYVISDVGLWRSTSAITRLDVFNRDAKTWGSGSTFTLYGITAA